MADSNINVKISADSSQATAAINKVAKTYIAITKAIISTTTHTLQNNPITIDGSISIPPLRSSENNQSH